MDRRTAIASAGAGIALVALLAWAFAPRPVQVEVATATSGPFETTVDEDGRTRLRERYTVGAPLAGRLQRITLREGDAVAAGAVVAQLAPVLPQLLDARSRQELAARLAAADAAVQQAQARIEAAQVALDQARNDAQRSAQLAGQGFVAPSRRDADLLAVQGAQKSLEAAVQGRHIASHDLQQARAALQTASVGTPPASPGAPLLLRSPIAGRVLKVHQASEATVAPGAPLLDIGDTAGLEVVAELLTTEALLAQPGRPVRIERWGGPGTLQGRVRRVEPAAFTKVSALGVEEQRVNVLIDITTPPADWAALGDGFRVAVRIVTHAETQVLRVPVSAVFPVTTTDAAADGGVALAHAVFVLEAGRARLRQVTLGGRNDRLAWVRHGLSAGATVIVYPPPTLVDGARVAVRRV